MTIQFGLRMKLSLATLPDEFKPHIKEGATVGGDFKDEFKAKVIKSPLGDTFLAINTDKPYGNTTVDMKVAKNALRELLGDYARISELYAWVEDLFLTEDDIYRDKGSSLL